MTFSPHSTPVVAQLAARLPRLGTRAKVPDAAGADPAQLLLRAAEGDTAAFMKFYDLTNSHAFCLALARARLVGMAEERAHAAAEEETLRRFVHAFRCAGEHATSGLSALAWLLTLDPRVAPADTRDVGKVAACA